MKMSNFSFDLAENKAEQERANAIEKARKSLRQNGSLECVDCGEEISEARRLALPSAKRCIACQTRIEKG